MMQTERCLIRVLSREDFPFIIDMYQEPDSNKYIGPLKDKSREDQLEFLELKLRESEEDPSFFSLWSKANPSEFLGTINVNVFKALGLPQIGAHLARKIWGQGYASELMPWMLNYAKEQKGWNEVYGIFESRHPVSKKLLEKFYFESIRQTELQGVTIEIYSKSL